MRKFISALGVFAILALIFCSATVAGTLLFNLPVPTVTPEPLVTGTPIASPPANWTVGAQTTRMRMSDSFVDGVGVDTGYWQTAGGSPNAVLGFSTQLHYMCPNAAVSVGVGTSYAPICFRHERTGSLNSFFSNVVADDNYMETIGIDALEEVKPYDSATAVAGYVAGHVGGYSIIPRNEPDGSNQQMELSASTTAGANGVGTTSINSNFLPIGTNVYVGEGPNRDTATVASYSVTNIAGVNANVTFTSNLTHAHNGGIATTLSGAISGATPYPPNANFPTTPPLTAWPPVVPTPGTVTSFTVASASGMSVNDWITLDCDSHNGQGNLDSMEVTQITGISSNTLTVSPALTYAHSNNGTVVEGCISRVPDNVYGAVQQFNAEQQRLKAMFPNTKVGTPAYANGLQSADAFSPFYGGTPFPYSSFDFIQRHGACTTNCAGNYGDGTTTPGGTNSPYCFQQNVRYNSWQFRQCGTITAGATFNKPSYCAECGWQTVPVGAPATSGGFGYNDQIPDDVAAAYGPRGLLFDLWQGDSRYYFIDLIDNQQSAIFCNSGIVYSSLCTASLGVASGTAPKAIYYAVTDLMGLMNDPYCRVPGCSFTPDYLTWGWTSMPPTNHLANNLGTDPGQLRSYRYEKSNGEVLIALAYEGTDYSFAGGACATTTSCYQWGNVAGNTQSDGNRYGVFSTNYYVQGSHNWGACTDWVTDDNPADSNFGHLIPYSSVSFNGSDLLAVTLTPTLQVIDCPSTTFSPVTSGTPLPSPTPVPAPVATHDPTPTPWPTPSTIPVTFVTPTAPPAVYIAQSGCGLISPVSFFTGGASNGDRVAALEIYQFNLSGATFSDSNAVSYTQENLTGTGYSGAVWDSIVSGSPTGTYTMSANGRTCAYDLAGSSTVSGAGFTGTTTASSGTTVTATLTGVTAGDVLLIGVNSSTAFTVATNNGSVVNDNASSGAANTPEVAHVIATSTASTTVTVTTTAASAAVIEFADYH